MFYGVKINDLMKAGLLSSGDVLHGARSGKHHTATILDSARLRTEDGTEFETLSGAADTLTGKSNNGWEFWSVRSGDGGDPVELTRIREEYLAQIGTIADTPET